ncbi:MAG: cyclase family protein [Proteobacteria bacterium]|nr:cyclase family protein [Pseudomonadota bacterium]
MAEIVDLSVALEDFMPAHKNFQRPFFIEHLSHERSRAWGLGTPEDPMTAATLYMSLLDHVGTHVDSFFHINPRAETIDEMPLDLFMGKAVVLDLRHVPDLGDIDVADLEQAERKAGLRIAGHIVLICTGFHARHYPRESVMHMNPGLTPAATHWLADRGSRVHGFEGPSTDKPTDPTFPSHRVCRDRKITHYEWLCNMERLVGRGEFRFQGIPLRIRRGTASPVRALAFLD